MSDKKLDNMLILFLEKISFQKCIRLASIKKLHETGFWGSCLHHRISLKFSGIFYDMHDLYLEQNKDSISIRSNFMRNFPVDTRRKLNVSKTFRRRPGCLLNALCTFNLRPVSTGLSETVFF